MLREWQKCALVIVVGSCVLPAWYEKLCRVKSNENGGKEKEKKSISGDNDDTSHLLTSAEKSPFVRTQKLFNFTYFFPFFVLLRWKYQHSLSSSTRFPFSCSAIVHTAHSSAEPKLMWCVIWGMNFSLRFFFFYKEFIFHVSQSDEMFVLHASHIANSLSCGGRFDVFLTLKRRRKKRWPAAWAQNFLLFLRQLNLWLIDFTCSRRVRRRQFSFCTLSNEEAMRGSTHIIYI